MAARASRATTRRSLDLRSMHAVDAALAKATDQINRKQVTRLAERILGTARGGRDGGHSGAFLQARHRRDRRVAGSDAGAATGARRCSRVRIRSGRDEECAKGFLGSAVTYSESMEACAGQAAVLVIATPWKHFAALRPEHLSKSGGRPVVMDWWRHSARAEFEAAAEYITCGRGPAVTRAAAGRKAECIAQGA